ncbi:MAG: hypothetical protein ACYTG6_16995 [Planctomycetota bacterium]|jgi:predicted esterase
MRRRSTFLLFLAGVLVPWLVPPTATRADGLSSADRRKVAEAFHDYVREADEEKRDALWKTVRRLAGRLTFEETESLVREAVPGDAWKAGFTHDVEFEAEGETWTYSVHLPRRRPEGLVPLVLDPGHGSLQDAGADGIEDVMSTWLSVSGAENDVIYVRTRVIDRLGRDGRYDAWSRPRREADEPNLDTIARLLLSALRDAATRYPVDPDRVYVHGISQTGFWSWWLGTFAPDRFAAIAPVSSVTWHVRRLHPNLRVTPVFILHGTADAVCPFAQAKSAADALEALGAPVDFRPIEGGEHVAGVFPKWREMWPDVTAKVRDPHPRAFERLLVSDARPGAFWLRADGIEAGAFNPFAPPVRIAGEIEGQTVRLEANGVASLTVYLASDMVDLTKRVRIEVNGRKAYAGRPKPDPRAVLDLARERGDGAPYATAITVEVR